MNASGLSVQNPVSGVGKLSQVRFAACQQSEVVVRQGRDIKNPWECLRINRTAHCDLFWLHMQLVFALISPGKVVANLAAGAIAEAGAQQAGDMMQVLRSLCNHVSLLCGCHFRVVSWYTRTVQERFEVEYIGRGPLREFYSDILESGCSEDMRFGVG